MKKISSLALLVCSFAAPLYGCSAETPQASEEVKKQVMGRKPTAEELEKAMAPAREAHQKAMEKMQTGSK